MGPFARKNGAIGSAGKIPNKKNLDLKFAVYPDYETGRKAQALRLKEGKMYIDSTLNEFLRIYTGVEKGTPDTEEVINYRKSIKFFTKFDMDRTIRSLNDEEYEKLLEDWRGISTRIVHEYVSEGIEYADKRTIGSLTLEIGQPMTFLYDFGNQRKFNLQLEECRPEKK